jgi:hypothetical protein
MMPRWIRSGLGFGVPALVVGSVAMLLYRQILPTEICSHRAELVTLAALVAFTVLAAMSGFVLVARKRWLLESAGAGLVTGFCSALSGLILIPTIPPGPTLYCPMMISWGSQHPAIWSVLRFLSLPPDGRWFISRIALGVIAAVGGAAVTRLPRLRLVSFRAARSVQ